MFSHCYYIGTAAIIAGFSERLVSTGSPNSSGECRESTSGFQPNLAENVYLSKNSPYTIPVGVPAQSYTLKPE